MRTDDAIKIGLALGGLLIADQVFGWFNDPGPGGEVDPAPGDNRPATLTTSDARALADRIAVAVWGTGIVVNPFEDDADFAAALMVCNVTNDVRLLMNEYGNVGPITNRLNLTETVVAYLDADLRAAVNADYRAKGITITF